MKRRNIGINTFICGLLVIIMASCADKSDKFVGTWKGINADNTLNVAKDDGDKFIVVETNSKGQTLKNMATFDKTADKLSFNYSGTNVEINFDNSTGHLLINGHEMSKVSK